MFGSYEAMIRRTVDAAVEVLIANFTRQVSDSSLLVNLGRNRVLVIAEKTRESCGEWLGLIVTC